MKQKFHSKRLPQWDMKAIHVTRKGAECTSGLEINLYDGAPKNKDTAPYLKWTIPRSDFPNSGSDWTELVLDAPEGGSNKFNGLELVLRLRISDCTDTYLSTDEILEFQKSTSTIEYSEKVIEGEEKEINSLLQCWRHKKTANKAVLWFIGRNDCFMHIKVAKALFLDKGYDLYVLNWSWNGHCRAKGWVVSIMITHNFKLYLLVFVN